MTSRRVLINGEWHWSHSQWRGCGAYRYGNDQDVSTYVRDGWILGNEASVWSWFVWACECNPEGQKP